jgi:hypothetical protein
VGIFLVLVPHAREALKVDDLLARSDISTEKAIFTASNDWSSSVSYPRLDGLAVPIAIDHASGSWLAALGTWFHQSGNGRTDYLLERYLTYGAELLARELHGFFVVVAGDATTREVTVVTDIVGSLHFYYRSLSVGAVLSTSSLVLARLGNTTLDPVGCQEFLATGVMYEDRTFYNEVRKLPPASIIAFRDGKQVRQQRYWNPADLRPESFSAEQASEMLWDGLSAAARTIHRQYRAIACDLTGGYDSRAVAAALLGEGIDFTAVVSGPAESRDVIVSAGLAATFGLEHIHYPPSTVSILPEEMNWIGSLTDGECDLTEYVNVARIHHDLSHRFAISINGSFGEVARGYWWELLIPHVGAKLKLDSYKLARLRYAVGSHNSLLQARCEFDLIEHFKAIIDRAIEGSEDYPNTFQMDLAYLGMRMQRWQGRLASSTDRIWPCLSPFMFRPVLETMLQTRFAVRERSFLIRLMLARHRPALAEYPLEHGYPALPATWRTFPRFWPLLPHYSGKIIRKLRNRWVLNGRSASEKTRLELWRSDRVTDLLQPCSMRTTEILDLGKLEQLLQASRNASFPEEKLWSRLLTMEYALSKASANDLMRYHGNEMRASVL